MTTIVYSHPWSGSFNHSILETVKRRLDYEDIAYNLIDLTEDKFSASMTADDLRLYSRGRTADKNADRQSKPKHSCSPFSFIMTSFLL